jgi:YggT family protein
MIYLANLVRLVFAIYATPIFVRVIFAWLKPNMFNPIVRFVYTLTNPYLKLFAGIRFLRVGTFDLTPLLACFVFYLFMEFAFEALQVWDFSWKSIRVLAVQLPFRFVYFFLFIFIVAAALRLVFELLGRRVNGVVVSIVYSVSEPVVKPFRSLLFRSGGRPGFDVSVVISLASLVLARFEVLPRIHVLITALFG